MGILGTTCYKVINLRIKNLFQEFLNMFLFFLLKEVKQSLASERVPEEMSTLDKIYNRNISQGNTKYKTLREVRKGNTKRRVDQFENW